MKIAFTRMTIACALLVTGFTSCNKQQAGEEAGTMTTLNLKLSYGPASRATDNHATIEESAVKTIDVYIFDAASQALVNSTRLTASDFEPDGDDAYKNKNTTKIETTVGRKLVAVGINLPAGFPGMTSTATLRQAWGTNLASLTSAAGGFVMFSTELASVTLVPEKDRDPETDNKVKTSVDRVVAKVTVRDGGVNLDHTLGTFSNLAFAIGNSNTKLFPVQQVEEGVVKDPNWDSYDAGDFVSFSDYAPVNPQESYQAAWIVKYTPENTSSEPLEKNSTHAIIKATFVPKVFCDEAGRAIVPSNGTAVNFWTVKKANGDLYYFNNESTAQAYAGNVEGAVMSEKYEGGACYYSAYLNPSNGYNTLRNKFYQVNIKSIAPPGRPTPEPKDPEKPLTGSTDIDIDVDINSWTYVMNNYDLN